MELGVIQLADGCILRWWGVKFIVERVRIVLTSYQEQRILFHHLKAQ